MILPAELAWQWPLMRLVKNGLARESEIRSQWTIDRVMAWNDFLDLEAEFDLRLKEAQDRVQEVARG